MKKSQNTALIFSRILVFIVMGLILALSISTPWLVKLYIENFARAEVAEQLFLPTVLFLYAAMIPAVIAIISLDRLLCKIMHGELFVEKNVKLLKILYMCCFAEAVIFAGFGYYFFISFALAFAALFMGVMLRIVKNLIEEATILKDENDYTI